MVKAINDDELKRFVAEYAKLIDEGFAPGSDKTLAAMGHLGATGELARKWGINPDVVRMRLRKARTKGFALSIDKAEQAYYERKSQPVSSPRLPTEIIQESKLIAEVKRLRAENKALAKQLASADDFKLAVAGLTEPLEPVSFQSLKKEGEISPETAVLDLSDLQWGEVIDLGVMDGLNSYNTDIARVRLKRVFEVFVGLITRHWAGPPPERIIIILGGDLISGEIHEELAKTNSLFSIPALRDCAANISAGIRLIRKAVKCPIDIISVPGNHGRTTKKTESKLYAAHSYDTLCADLIEMEFKENGKWPDWFKMFKPSSGDALIWIYGYRVLITHGDRIGSRGGAGFVGTAATVARGFKKLVMDYAGRGIMLDFIICGHFHTALQLEEGICNGCLPGPSEYSRDLRFRPRPAVQAFLTFHPRRGVTQIRWIDAGDPSEGSLYEPKQPPIDGGKPRFRIPAIGIKT